MTRLFGIHVVSLGIVLFHALVRTPAPLHLRVLASLLCVAAFILWSRYFLSRDIGGFPFLEYAVTQFYVYWGLSTISASALDMPAVNESASAGAVLAACLVTVAVLLVHPIGRAFGTCAARLLAGVVPRTTPTLRPLIVIPWLGLAAAVHAHAFTGIIPPSAYHVVRVFGDYSPLLVAIALRDLSKGRSSPSFIACTGTLSLAGLLTGMMEAVIQPVLTAMTLCVVLQHRIPWRSIAAGALLAIVLNPAKHYYREMAWQSAESAKGHVATDPLLAANQWWKAFKSAWLSDDSDRTANAAALASRLNESSINAVVLEKTPVAVPFDYGRNWVYIAMAPVPRLLYPDKPNFTRIYNDRFSLTYGFQTLEATESSTAAYPLVADGYWNFGWPGVIFVACVAGWLIGVFSGAFRARSWAVASIAVSSFVDLHATSSMAAQIMGVLQRVGGMVALLWVVWIVSHSTQGEMASLRPQASTVTRG
jgi:hypothetical protein